MCFSATASFAGAAVLGVVGAATIARNTSPPHRMLAAIPLLFAVQQASEGVVWITMTGATHAASHQLAVYVFLGFALVFWPAWVPAALYRVERDAARRRVLKYQVWLGTVVSLSALALLLRQPPTTVMAGHSISYHFAGPTSEILKWLVIVAYVIPTVTPLFVSTSSMSRTIGVALVGSIVLASVVQHNALTSVWCFFASFLSILTYVAVGREQSLHGSARTPAIATAAV